MRRDKEVVGEIVLNIHAGRFVLAAKMPLTGRTEVFGETIDDIRYDIDYSKARKSIAQSLRHAARTIEKDKDFVKMMEEGGEG